jgi:hypothetical protein
MEREVLPQVIASGHYSLVADPGSIEGLRQAQAQQPATILHFLGHGVAASPYSVSAPMPNYLIFTSADGKPQYVTGQQLRQILGEASKLQMIVLASCDTGTAGASNIAHDLVLGGFPYVVAMQSKMPQPALYHFIRRFYRELQNGQPPEYAVAAGRSEIAANLPGSIDWCLPVLYTSAGVAERSWLPHVIEQVNKVFSRTFFARMWIITGGIGILHLMVGLLLWISGVTLSSPDGRSLLQSMGWLALAPPLLAALFFRYGKLPLAADRPHETRLTLWLRLWAAVSIGLGIAAIYGIHFSVALLAGLGFWALLSPAAQWIALLPLQLVSLLFGLVQAHSHGLGFITSDHVRSIPLDGSDTVLIVAGYLMLLGPPLLFLLFPGLLAPPWLNFLVGILNVGISMLLYRQRKMEGHSSE